MGGVRELGKEVGLGDAGDTVGVITVGLSTVVLRMEGSSTSEVEIDGGSQLDEKRRVSIKSISSAT